MRRGLVLCGLALAGAVGGCGGNGGTSPTGPAPGASNGSLRATVNGSSWVATQSITVTRYPNGIAPFTGVDVLAFAGFNPSDLTSMGASIVLQTPPVATYTLAAGNAAMVLAHADGRQWLAFDPGAGATGTVTVSVFTSNRIAGTFAFTAIPGAAGTGVKTVTNGSFDITY
jgi:hypothetical protein